ncbi:hypothetical protein BS50DRAFT_294393 [Corynespora cassiicola Philippines]|uniref:Uncharacterized protein n=1 Tax=Corynespora cassiicola Philippines TaxID=1448308 RepID=A0A2T2NW83_CORCC|nr:hypothetical protein BS50DRAFT_294393 [Corynespora cassiicola Philippines]
MKPSEPSKPESCRCAPFEPCWPSQKKWSALNKTIDGRLIKTVPPYNEEAYNALKRAWPYAQAHIPSTSSFVSPLAQNHSCDPFSPRESPCTLGNYLVYAINASEARHIAIALEFAKKRNIHLIVKSTGHNVLGKSSGANLLSRPNRYNNYPGPAARIEPGLQPFEIYDAAHKAGLHAIGGTCSTVAVGGGYTRAGAILC